MKQSHLNLPNPLAAREALFMSTDGQPFTTSRAVAERFGKRHKDVLKTIKNLLENCPDPDFHRRNFAPMTYLDIAGKGARREQLEYHLTHDGFAFLAMRFTGKEAMAWQIAFLQAFNALETELLARETRYARALDQIRPALRPVTEETESGASRAVIAVGLGKSVHAITYHRRKARELGLLPMRISA